MITFRIFRVRSDCFILFEGPTPAWWTSRPTNLCTEGSPHLARYIHTYITCHSRHYIEIMAPLEANAIYIHVNIKKAQPTRLLENTWELKKEEQEIWLGLFFWDLNFNVPAPFENNRAKTFYYLLPMKTEVKAFTLPWWIRWTFNAPFYCKCIFQKFVKLDTILNWL